MKNNLRLNKTAVTQPTVKPHRCIKLGLDVHAESIRVVRMLDAATPQPAQKMTQPDFLKWVQKQLALADEVYSCYEAGPMGFGLHRKLIAMGIRNVVVRPQCLDDFMARMKTDKIDALGLAKRLDFYVQGNRTALAVIRVPSEKEEQERALSRQREQLVRTTKQLAAQGRSLMLYQGFRVIGVWWRRQWPELCRRLPEWLVQRLEVFRGVLLVLDKQVNALTTQLETAAPSGLPYGLGPLSFEVIRREIGDWKRFKNRRQVGSFTGLCSGVSSSGNKRRTLSINKCGNPRLRSALVVAAWRFLQYQPQSRLLQKWKHVLLTRRQGGSSKKRAIVAVARQLMVDLWRWQTDRIKPKELAWRMAA